MEQFKIGDRVRLTGPEWDYEGVMNRGNVLTIKDTDTPNYVIFEEDLDWVKLDDGWEVELVQPVEFINESSFESNVRRHTDRIADLLIEKNKAYGDSALNPIRVFSKSDRMEQLFVRLDDKLSRVQKGHEYPGDDTIRDIIGYCTLILIARESN